MIITTLTILKTILICISEKDCGPDFCRKLGEEGNPKNNKFGNKKRKVNMNVDPEKYL